MTLSNSPQAYTDCRDWFEKALAADKGIRITCESKGKATSIRQRMYKLRTIDQKENMKTFPQGDPMHGRSPYDVLTIVQDDNILFVKHRDPEAVKVEEL